MGRDPRGRAAPMGPLLVEGGGARARSADARVLDAATRSPDEGAGARRAARLRCPGARDRRAGAPGYSQRRRAGLSGGAPRGAVATPPAGAAVARRFGRHRRGGHGADHGQRLAGPRPHLRGHFPGPRPSDAVRMGAQPGVAVEGSAAGHHGRAVLRHPAKHDGRAGIRDARPAAADPGGLPGLDGPDVHRLPAVAAAVASGGRRLRAGPRRRGPPDVGVRNGRGAPLPRDGAPRRRADVDGLVARRLSPVRDGLDRGGGHGPVPRRGHGVAGGPDLPLPLVAPGVLDAVAGSRPLSRLA